MNIVLLKNQTFLLCSTHICMHVLFHILYYTIEKNNTSTTEWLRSLLFWDAVWHRLVVGYGSCSSSWNQDIFQQHQ